MLIRTHTHKKKNVSLNESISTSYVKSKGLQIVRPSTRSIDYNIRLKLD